MSPARVNQERRGKLVGVYECVRVICSSSLSGLTTRVRLAWVISATFEPVWMMVGRHLITA